MSQSAYNTVMMVLSVGLLGTFLILVISFVFIFVRWKSPTRRSHVIRFAVALAAIPCFFATQQAILWWVFLPSLGRQRMAEHEAARAKQLAETSLAQLGDVAPPFSLTTADGDRFAMPESGTVTLVNFFATWCGPCQIELPHLEKIWNENKHNQQFRLLVIGREETRESVLEYRAQKRFTFPIAADTDRAVYSLFATESIPRTVVVGPDGRIVYSKAGFSEYDLDELRDVLGKQLASL